MTAANRTGEFRTKTGRCLIDDDAIRLEHRSTGDLRNVYDGLIGGRGRLRRKGLAWGVTLAMLAVVGAGVYFVPWFGAFLTLAIVAAFAVSYYRKRKYRFTDTDEIPLDAVESVAYRSGVPVLTRPRFVVRYREDGVTKRRYVMLPSGLYAETQDAIATAKRLFAEHDIPIED